MGLQEHCIRISELENKKHLDFQLRRVNTPVECRIEKTKQNKTKQNKTKNRRLLMIVSDDVGKGNNLLLMNKIKWVSITI